ncbi:MAG: hypothetical protein M1381_09310, partial [Deltaproteobacteria bacterium]|nr:hypothetical protein [Deltaproteobacteria bacterium]
GVTGGDTRLVIADDTGKADQDRGQAHTTCPVLLHASGGGPYQGMDMARHHEEDKPALSFAWITINRYCRMKGIKRRDTCL